MQFGGRQVYTAVESFLDEKPETLISVSPSWANGADVIANFYLPDPIPIQLGNIDHYIYNHLPLEEGRVFVMTAKEYQKTIDSGKFMDIRIHKILDYPDGRPGFYFVTLEYVDNIDEILEMEKAERRELRKEEILLDGELVDVRYPLLDMGRIEDLWDGDPRSVARTYEANPFQLEFIFPEPRILEGLWLVIGDTDVRVQALLYPAEGIQADEVTTELSGSVQNPEVYFDFGESKEVKKLVLYVTDLLQDEPAHVHLWEIEFE
jgi:hypothetical protein